MRFLIFCAFQAKVVIKIQKVDFYPTGDQLRSLALFGATMNIMTLDTCSSLRPASRTKLRIAYSRLAASSSRLSIIADINSWAKFFGSIKASARVRLNSLSINSSKKATSFCRSGELSANDSSKSLPCVSVRITFNDNGSLASDFRGFARNAFNRSRTIGTSFLHVVEAQAVRH